MLSLMGSVAISLVRQASQKKLFGKPKIEYAKFLQIGGFLYESGALIGRALSDKPSALEQILGNPEHEGGLITFIKEAAQERKKLFPE